MASVIISDKVHEIDREASSVMRFLLAGNATITLQNRVSGDHRTFRIKRSEDGKKWFVSFMSGNDNETGFSYMGLLENRLGETRYRLTDKSRYRDDSTVQKTWQWFFAHITRGNIPANLAVFHAGRCCVCGRKLTVPASVASGIGPECAKR
jgi:hypothetical protein